MQYAQTRTDAIPAITEIGMKPASMSLARRCPARYVDHGSPPGGAGEPSAPQSVGAQLHHQPTPGSVQSAEHKARADSEAALNRARKADAEGNASACAKALTEARALYGIQ